MQRCSGTQVSHPTNAKFRRNSLCLSVLLNAQKSRAQQRRRLTRPLSRQLKRRDVMLWLCHAPSQGLTWAIVTAERPETEYLLEVLRDAVALFISLRQAL